MKLQFETQPEYTEDFELPMLVGVDSIHVGESTEGLVIDGKEILLDYTVTQNIANVIGAINDEVLPEGHFRDCVSFTMAICGVWLPTHKPFDAAYDFALVCDEEPKDDAPIIGPMATGIPKDDSCLGFENVDFIYSHMAFGFETASGNLFVYKDGTAPEYFISSLSTMLAWYEHTVAHSVIEVRVSHRERGVLASWVNASLGCH